MAFMGMAFMGMGHWAWGMGHGAWEEREKTHLPSFPSPHLPYLPLTKSTFASGRKLGIS